MGLTITNCWKLFPYGFMKDHYEKFIGIRELSKQLSKNCFNNTFSSETGTLYNNIPLFDEFDGGEIVSTFRALHFSSCIYSSTAASTFSGITPYSASSISIVYQHMSEREEDREGGRYNRITRVYCSDRLSNGKRRLQKSLWFYKGCNRFNKKTYYC